MPLSCVKLSAWHDFRKVLAGRGLDFWVSALASTTVEEMPDKLATMRVEDQLVADVFTHCYLIESTDIKAESNMLLDEFGLGLRKVRVRSRAEPGCMFCFVSDNGPSLLFEQKQELSSLDRRLSAEERLRRTRMKFEVTNKATVLDVAKRHFGRFWLTSYSDVTAETCKKRVVCGAVDKQPMTERFGVCYIAEVENCKEVSDLICLKCGTGSRNSMPRSRMESGCIVLMLPDESPRPTPPSKSEPATSAKRPTPSTEDPTGASDAKRAKSSGGPTLPLVTSGHRQTAGTTGAFATLKSAPGQALAVEEPSTSADPEGDLRYKQICVIEKRLATLLPTLPREQLSTPFVQKKLELYMQKQVGRLDKFKDDIARVWRAYVDRTKEET